MTSSPHIFLSLMMTKRSFSNSSCVIHKGIREHMVLQQIILLADEILMLLLLSIRCLLLKISKKMLILSRVDSLWCTCIIATKWMLNDWVWVQNLWVAVDLWFERLLSIVKLTAKVSTWQRVLLKPLWTQSIHTWWSSTMTCHSMSIDSTAKMLGWNEIKQQTQSIIIFHKVFKDLSFVISIEIFFANMDSVRLHVNSPWYFLLLSHVFNTLFECVD